MRTGVIIWLVLSQLLGVLSLVVWVMVAGFSLMAFDGGISTGPMLLVAAIWAYPLFPLGCYVVSWLAFSRQRHLAASLCSAIPLIPACGLLLLTA